MVETPRFLRHSHLPTYHPFLRSLSLAIFLFEPRQLAICIGKRVPTFQQNKQNLHKKDVFKRKKKRKKPREKGPWRKGTIEPKKDERNSNVCSRYEYKANAKYRRGVPNVTDDVEWSIDSQSY